MSATKEQQHNEIEAGMRPDEHPILFSTEMVKAILEGRKTMTRRLTGLKTVNESPLKWEFTGLGVDKTIKVFKNFVLYTEKLLVGLYAQFRKFKKEEFCYCQCPYGKPGDLLWVRETWQTAQSNTFYLADGEVQSAVFKWRPSIHMPKEAARIWLQVEEVRVERLQDISEEDAKAEGVKIHSRGNFYLDYVAEAFNTTQFIYRLPSAKQSFKTLWELINERRKNLIEKHGITWIDNPWVWVVKFKVLSTNGKPSFDSAQDDGNNGAQDDKS